MHPWAKLCQDAEIAFDEHESSESLLRRLREAEAHVGGMHFVRPRPIDWVAILLRATESSRAHWSLLAAGLEPLGSYQGRTLYLDRLEDEAGAHRVYEVEPVFRRVARDADDLLDVLAGGSWMQDSADDPWTTHPRSAERVVPLFRRLHPAELFRAHRDRHWPKPPPPPKFVGLGPGWIRGVMVYVLATFYRQKKVALPEVDLSELLGVQHDLIARLEDLEQAINHDDVPERVAMMALADDDDVSEAAQAWMQRFDDARDRPTQTGYSDSQQASNADVRGALKKAVAALIKKELLELEDTSGVRGALIDELTESFFRTVSLVERGAEMDRTQIIRRLVDTMIDSNAVVDVYGDDATLEQVFRIAMGA